MGKEKMERWVHYAALIQGQIQEMFKEEAEYRIDPNDFTEDDGENFKMFLHALATAVPASLYNKLSDESDNVDALGFNHIANQLCFEYCSPSKED